MILDYIEGFSTKEDVKIYLTCFHFQLCSFSEFSYIPRSLFKENNIIKKNRTAQYFYDIVLLILAHFIKYPMHIFEVFFTFIKEFIMTLKTIIM